MYRTEISNGLLNVADIPIVFCVLKLDLHNTKIGSFLIAI